MDTNNELAFNTTEETTGRYKLRSSLKKRKSRNPLEILDIPEVNVNVTVAPRRVSFAASNYVKPFADDPEKITIWDVTYEEAVNHTDSTKSENTNTSEAKSHFQDESQAGLKKDPNVISNIYCDQSVVDMESTCVNGTTLKDSSEENISKNATALSKESLMDMEITCKWTNNIISSNDIPQKSAILNRDHLEKNSTIYQVADMSMTLCEHNENPKCKTMNIFKSDLANQPRSILSDKENIFFSIPHESDMEFTCLFQNKILEMTKSHQNFDDNSLEKKYIVPVGAKNMAVTKNENAYMPCQSGMDFTCFMEDQLSETEEQRDFEKSFIQPTIKTENKENECIPKLLKRFKREGDIVLSPNESTCNFQNKIEVNEQTMKFGRNSILHATVNEPAEMEFTCKFDLHSQIISHQNSSSGREQLLVNPRKETIITSAQENKAMPVSPDIGKMDQKSFSQPASSNDLIDSGIERNDPTTQESEPLKASHCTEKIKQNSLRNERCDADILDKSTTEANNFKIFDSRMITATDNIGRIDGNSQIEMYDNSTQENQPIVHQNIEKIKDMSFNNQFCGSDQPKSQIESSITKTYDSQAMLASCNIEKKNQNSPNKKPSVSNPIVDLRIEMDDITTQQLINAPEHLEKMNQNSLTKGLCGSTNLGDTLTEIINTKTIIATHNIENTEENSRSEIIKTITKEDQLIAASQRDEKIKTHSSIIRGFSDLVNSETEINDTKTKQNEPITAPKYVNKIDQISPNKEISGSNHLVNPLTEMNNTKTITATHKIDNIDKHSGMEISNIKTRESQLMAAPEEVEKIKNNSLRKDLRGSRDPADSQLELNNAPAQGDKAMTAPSKMNEIKPNPISEPVSDYDERLTATEYVERINENSRSEKLCATNNIDNSTAEINNTKTCDSQVIIASHNIGKINELELNNAPTQGDQEKTASRKMNEIKPNPISKPVSDYNERLTAPEYVERINQNSRSEKLCATHNIDNSPAEINNTKTCDSQAIIASHNIGKIDGNARIEMNNTITQESQLMAAPHMAETIKHNSLSQDQSAFNDTTSFRTEVKNTMNQDRLVCKKSCGNIETYAAPLINLVESRSTEKFESKKNKKRLPFLEKNVKGSPGNVFGDIQSSGAENDTKKPLLNERSSDENIMDSCIGRGNKTIIDEECSLIDSIPSLNEEDLKCPEPEIQMEVSENKEEHPSISETERSPQDKMPVNKVIYSEPMKIAIYDEFPSMQTSGLINPFNFSSIASMEDTQQLIQATFSKPQLQKTDIFEDERSQSETFSKPQVPMTDNHDEEKSQSAMFLKPQCPIPNIFEDDKSQSGFRMETDKLHRNEENKCNETNTMEAVLTNIQNEVTHIQFQDIDHEKLRKTIEGRRQISIRLESFLPNFRFPEIPVFDLEQKRKSQSLPNISFDENSIENSLEEMESGEDTNCNKSMLLEPSKSFHEKIISFCKRSKTSLSLKHFEENKLYSFSTLNGSFMVYVETHPEDGRVIEIKSTSCLNDSTDVTARFLHKCFQEKLRKTTLESYLGSYYDVLSLLDHICLMVDEVKDFHYEFLSLQNSYQTLKFQDDFSISFEILHSFPPLWWSIKLNLASFTKIDPDSLQLDSKWGNINEEHIKQILRNIDEGGSSLRNFISKVVEYFERTQSKYKLR